MRTGVDIIRKWGRAEIEVSIYKRGESPDGKFIALHADLDTFKKMLKEELVKAADSDMAVENVLSDIKGVTRRVVR